MSSTKYETNTPIVVPTKVKLIGRFKPRCIRSAFVCSLMCLRLRSDLGYRRRMLMPRETSSVPRKCIEYWAWFKWSSELLLIPSYQMSSTNGSSFLAGDIAIDRKPAHPKARPILRRLGVLWWPWNQLLFSTRHFSWIFWHLYMTPILIHFGIIITMRLHWWNP
jgi:hypothetical protein